MGENIRQTPIRTRLALLVLVAITTSISTRVGLHFVPRLDPRSANLVALAAALGAAGILGLGLKLRYPSFRLDPGEVQRLERGGRAYRIHLAGGRTRHVLITGSPARPGTAHQLLNVLPGVMVSGSVLPAPGQISTVEQHGHGRSTRWTSITRAEAVRELQTITQGSPPPTSPEAAPASPGEPAPSNTADYLEQRDRAGAPAYPERALVQQWERDDAYGAEQLAAADVRLGTFGLLRFLTWAVMIASLVYLGVEEETDGMTVSITLWSIALFIGLIRGILIDLRVRRARAAVARLASDHPHLKRRGMPEPWVRAAGWSPGGTAGLLRAASFLLALLFLIGLIAVIGDSEAAATGVIAAIFATCITAWILLSVHLGRKRAARKRISEELAGPRQYWLDHPEHLVFPDDEVEPAPADEDS